MTSIVLTVCERRGVSVAEFFARGRACKRVVAARREAIGLLLAAGFSAAGTARMMRRNISTVRYWRDLEDRRRRRERCRGYEMRLRRGAAASTSLPEMEQASC